MVIGEQHYQLIEAARMGNITALDRLLRMSQPDIRRYAQRHCLVNDVDDAVQEALLIKTHRLQLLRVVGWRSPAACSRSCSANVAVWSDGYSALILTMKEKLITGWQHVLSICCGLTWSAHWNHFRSAIARLFCCGILAEWPSRRESEQGWAS